MEVLPVSANFPDGTEEDIDRERTRRRWWWPGRRPDLLFIAVVVVPVLASVLYFGVLASDVYISESRFVVRAPEKSAPVGIGAILQSAGFANANEEVSAAQSYAVSRDALRAINTNDAFENAYTRPEISIVDRFNPLGLWGSFEQLYQYFQGKVTIKNDTMTQITTLTVRAYTPQDARKFNERLLELSEGTINRLNLRGREDLVRFAQVEVDKAKTKAQSAALALAAYRNRSGVVDPDKQAEVQMQMISNLQNQLIAGKTELAQLRRYAPENPRIPVVRTQIAAIQQQIDQETGKITGGTRSLAGSAVQFQRLSLENDFATKQLSAALASLEQAQNEARRKQVYVERIVQPNLPDGPLEPHRGRGILSTVLLSLLAYGILKMLLAGVREHAR
jgi:capsular polysaccharide transport system permease protein